MCALNRSDVIGRSNLNISLPIKDTKIVGVRIGVVCEQSLGINLRVKIALSGVNSYNNYKSDQHSC